MNQVMIHNIWSIKFVFVETKPVKQVIKQWLGPRWEECENLRCEKNIVGL